MNYKRAIKAGLMVYAITFILSLVAIFTGFNFQDTGGTMSAGTWIFGGVTAVLATGIGAWWYYRKKGTVANINTGFHLGLVTIVVSFVLDWLAFLPAIQDPASMELITTYYGNPAFWLIVILVVVTATLFGKYHDKFAKTHKKSH